MMKPLTHTLLGALFAIACVCTAPESKAAHVWVDNGIGGTYSIKTKSLLERRFQHVYRQQFDFSCGSAALASLLTFHYDRLTSEPTVIKVMYNAGDKEKIQKEGFSLLDMKNYLDSIGLRSNGYHEPIEKLAAVGVPAIVLINRGGYMHFVIVQGLTKNKVLIGDPAQGKKIVDTKTFRKMWVNGILFVIESELSRGRNHFSTVDLWGVKPTYKFHTPLPDTYLADTTLFTSILPNQFK